MTDAPLLVSASGSRTEIGFEHGAQARDLVRGTLEWSLEQLATGGVDRAEARSRVEQLVPFISSQAPELLEECDGIAQGAGLELTDVLIINARYELLFLDGSRAPRPGVAGAECTLFGVGGGRTEDGAPIIGQNVDLGADARPFWILLDVAPTGAPRVLTVTMAGMLAQEGINDAGLALCGSMVRSGGWGAGLPTRKFLRRQVLEQRTVAEALRKILSIPRRASSHNLLLADEHSMVDVETTAREVRVLEPAEGTLAHTNHYLHDENLSWNDGLGDYLKNSTTRHDSMARLLAEAPARVSVEDLRAILSDHSGEPHAICRHGSRDAWHGETNVAVISEPAKNTMHVGLGPPCESAFTSWSFPRRAGAALIARPLPRPPTADPPNPTSTHVMPLRHLQ